MYFKLIGNNTDNNTDNYTDNNTDNYTNNNTYDNTNNNTDNYTNNDTDNNIDYNTHNFFENIIDSINDKINYNDCLSNNLSPETIVQDIMYKFNNTEINNLDFSDNILILERKYKYSIFSYKYWFSKKPYKYIAVEFKNYSDFIIYDELKLYFNLTIYDHNLKVIQF